AAMPQPGRFGVDGGAALSPAPDTPHNQKIANAIADSLRHNGQLRSYHVNVVYINGVAELTGQVTDEAQHDEVLRIVHGVPGVEHIRDLLLVGGVNVRPVQAAEPPKLEVVPKLDLGPKLETGPPPRAQDLPPEPAPIYQGVPHGVLPNPAIQPPRMPPY